MLNFILARLREPSTWRALVVLLTTLGVSISPEQSTAIVVAGASLFSAIGLFTPDQLPNKTPVSNKESDDPFDDYRGI